jgi:hypothetical protein
MLHSIELERMVSLQAAAARGAHVVNAVHYEICSTGSKLCYRQRSAQYWQPVLILHCYALHGFAVSCVCVSSLAGLLKQ